MLDALVDHPVAQDATDSRSASEPRVRRSTLRSMRARTSGVVIDLLGGVPAATLNWRDLPNLSDPVHRQQRFGCQLRQGAENAHVTYVEPAARRQSVAAPHASGTVCRRAPTRRAARPAGRAPAYLALDIEGMSLAVYPARFLP